MSLVNDMLRDLDQRRRDTEGPAARVKLTPAGDEPKKTHKFLVPGVTLGLVLVAAGLGYVWLQMNAGIGTRQLDISVTPRQPSQAAVVEERAAEERAAEELTIEESAQPIAVTGAVAVTVPEPVASAPAAIEPASVVTPSTVNSPDETPQLSEAPQPVAVASETPTSVASASVPRTNAEVLPEPATTAQTETVPSASVPVLAPALAGTAPETLNTPANTASTEDPANASISLESFSPESVKESIVLTADEKDTLTVQEALRLIASNQTPEAFATLEQQLMNNPSAHQTRETYAKLLMNQGDNALALDLADQGLAIAPNHSGYKKVKARALIADGSLDEAVTLLVSRAPQISNDLEYHEILASAQLATRDFRGAAISYSGLVQQDQGQGRWWYGYAAAQDSLGNEREARQAYNRAIEQPNLSASLRRRSQDRLSRIGQ